MKKLLSILGILFSVSAGFGQTVKPEVVASAGNFFLNTQANASLSFTIGEMTMVQTFQNQGHFLTQGFQQPEINLVGIDEEDIFYEFVIFPNPANQDLGFRYRLRYPGQVRMRLINMNGVQVLDGYEDLHGIGLREDAFDVRGLAQGMYFLEVSYVAPARGIDHHRNYKINVIHY
jgi:hypothetical protein